MNQSTRAPGTDPPDPISREEFRRHWQVITAAGLLGMTYFTIIGGGAPRIKFLTELSATAFDFGLMAGAASLAIVFQLLSGLFSNLIPRRKALWITLCVVHRALFLAVLAAPVLFLSDRTRIWWIIAVLFIHDVLMHLGQPLWFAWITDLMPRQSFNRQWAWRQWIITTVSIFISIFVAVAFHWFEVRHQVILGFVILGGFGVLLGVIDILMFISVPELPTERSQRTDFKEMLAEPLRDRQFRPYLIFMCHWCFSAMTAAPFMGVYLIQEVHLSVLMTQVVMTMGIVGIAVSSRFWGLLCDTYGPRAVLQMAITGKVLIPMAYLFSPPLPVYAITIVGIVSFIDGIMNSGMMLAAQSIMLQQTPRANRPMYIAITNFICTGLAGGLAPLIAGWAITWFNGFFAWDFGLYHLNGYHVIFFASILLRFKGLELARRVTDVQMTPVRTVLSHLRTSQPLRQIRLIYQLQDSSHTTRRAHAAQTLGNLRSPLAIRELIGALEDSSHTVRNAAADALGKIGVAEASQPLARALVDSSLGIQSPAARALGQIGGRESLQVLIHNLGSMSDETLGETIESLVRIGDDSAILPLICLFEDVESPELRRRIAAAISQLSRTESEEEMMSLITVTPQMNRMT